MNLMSRGCVLRKDSVVIEHLVRFLPGFYQMLALENLMKETRVVISIDHPTEEGLKQSFQDDWRAGKEIQKIMISRRLYQVSPNETKS